MSGTACGPVRFIDLFAGIGGIRLGFERAFRRHETVFVSEWDTYAQATYRTNFPTPAEIAGDITKISEKDVPPFDVCLAGFPYQIFSVEPETKAERKKRAADENFRTGVFGADGRHIAVPRLKGFVVGHGAHPSGAIQTIPAAQSQQLRILSCGKTPIPTSPEAGSGRRRSLSK